MATKEEIEAKKTKAEEEQRNRHASLVKQVLAALGTPENLYAVDVHEVSVEAYRVNIIVSHDGGSLGRRITDSFYVQTEESILGEIEIIKSDPAIRRRYP